MRTSGEAVRDAREVQSTAATAVVLLTIVIMAFQGSRELRAGLARSGKGWARADRTLG